MNAAYLCRGQNDIIRLFLRKKGLYVGLSGQIQLGVGSCYNICKSGFF